MDKSEILGDSINVEELICKVKENIRRRKSIDVQEIKIHNELEYINSNWDIQNSGYFISSHRPIYGKFLVRSRELILGEIRRYVDPTTWKQREFNSSIVKILNDITGKLKGTSSQIDEKIAESQSIIISQILDKITQSQSMKGINHIVFEEKVRGSREYTRKKQSKFIKYFESCTNVLDIGCGRGEFLELLKEHRISGCGIDVDEDMIEYCRSLKLDAEKMDAISYLNLLNDDSLDGIFVDQVVEHLAPSYLINMIGLCYLKMKVGAKIIIGTVNPLSMVCLASFHKDMSRGKPVHPDTLKFIMQSAGYIEPVTQFYDPIEECQRLKLIDATGLKENEKQITETINQNTEILNSLIYGPQYYAIIGKK